MFFFFVKLVLEEKVLDHEQLKDCSELIIIYELFHKIYI